MGDRQHGQFRSSGSIVTCTRGRSGKRSAVRPALFRPRCGSRLVLPVVDRFAGRDSLLDVLQRQGKLIRIELLGLSAELHPLKLA
jgi:hypothetical protein